MDSKLSQIMIPVEQAQHQSPKARAVVPLRGVVFQLQYVATHQEPIFHLILHHWYIAVLNISLSSAGDAEGERLNVAEILGMAKAVPTVEARARQTVCS